MLRPLRDCIVVKPIKRPLSAIIHVPVEERNEYGEVLAVGPGKRDPKTGALKPVGVNPGDKILFSPQHDYDGAEGNIIIFEGDVVGVVNA